MTEPYIPEQFAYRPGQEGGASPAGPSEAGSNSASTGAPGAAGASPTAANSPEVPKLTVPEVAKYAGDVLAEVGTAVVGMTTPLKIALAAVLAGGHVLFEDVPGLGKTLAARSLAQALGLDFSRVQCTPDLLPADITGSSMLNPKTREFEFQPGPVFTGLLLADEINRTAPKTQSALLEAMAERQVSVDGRTYPLQAPFHVFATSNPVEYEGTYPLPEAQLDRFMVRLGIGHPERAAEIDVLSRRLARQQEAVSVKQVVNATTLRAMQAAVERIGVDEDILGYAVDLTGATRNHDAVEVGASPRGSQALVLVARAVAAISGRDFIVPEDIKLVADAVLTHRLTLTPGAWALGLAADDVVKGIVSQVPGPTSAPRGR